MNKSEAPSSGVARSPRRGWGGKGGMQERAHKSLGSSGFWEGEGVRLRENVEVEPDRKRVWLRPDLVMNERRLVSEEVFP